MDDRIARPPLDDRLDVWNPRPWTIFANSPHGRSTGNASSGRVSARVESTALDDLRQLPAWTIASRRARLDDRTRCPRSLALRSTPSPLPVRSFRERNDRSRHPASNRTRQTRVATSRGSAHNLEGKKNASCRRHRALSMFVRWLGRDLLHPLSVLAGSFSRAFLHSPNVGGRIPMYKTVNPTRVEESSRKMAPSSPVRADHDPTSEQTSNPSPAAACIFSPPQARTPWRQQRSQHQNQRRISAGERAPALTNAEPHRNPCG